MTMSGIYRTTRHRFAPSRSNSISPINASDPSGPRLRRINRTNQRVCAPGVETPEPLRAEAARAARGDANARVVYSSPGHWGSGTVSRFGPKGPRMSDPSHRRWSMMSPIRSPSASIAWARTVRLRSLLASERGATVSLEGGHRIPEADGAQVTGGSARRRRGSTRQRAPGISRVAARITRVNNEVSSGDGESLTSEPRPGPPVLMQPHTITGIIPRVSPRARWPRLRFIIMLKRSEASRRCTVQSARY